jgi:anti-sigma B factor antagonist
MSLTIQEKAVSSEMHEIILEGRLDNVTTRNLEELLEKLLAAGYRRLLFDLEKLSYISSIGLRLFLRTAKALESDGRQLVLIQMQAPIRKVFDLASVMGTLSIFESHEEADRHLNLFQKSE